MMNNSMAAQSLGALVAEAPARARVLEEFGLDYCCNGDRSLAEATRAAGIDPDAVVAALAAATASGASAADATTEAGDPVALIEDILSTHHAFLWKELPSLVALAVKVEDVHGSRHPELATVHRLVAALKEDLEPHMVKEERILFPAIRLLVEGQRQFEFGTINNPIRMMRFEHDQAGAVLAELRRITAGYAVPDDACASYEALYRRLEHVEKDTHLHIHKENNVLFPMVEALQARS
jgi:regulator of cell morphogenesis and NO signaling